MLHNSVTVFIATAPGKNNEITLSKKVGVSFKLSKRRFCWYWPVMGHQGTTLSQSSHNRLTHFLARSFDTFCSCCLVAKSCPTLCNPMDCSMPGFFVLHYLLEFAQIHVHWVHDAIQPSHLLLPPHPPSKLPHHQGIFKWAGSSHQVAKVLQLQHQSFQWIFRVDFLWDLMVWSPCCSKNSQECSPAPQFRSINSLVLSLINGPTLTSVRDYWKNQSLDYADLCHQSDF